MHGKASMQFPDGTCFDGSIASNAITGPGVVSYDAMRYHGSLVDGKHHGSGVLEVMGGGAKYEGDFQRGHRHGIGTFWPDASTPHGYTGEWRNDRKEGWGTMTYVSGSQYSGHWRNDQKSGFGTMQWKGRRERYRGFWAGNQPAGVGEHVWFAGVNPSAGSHAAVVRCNHYVGMFEAGQRHGEGVMLYSTGAVLSAAKFVRVLVVCVLDFVAPVGHAQVFKS